MLQTLREIREKTEGFFVAKGVPNAKLDADLLIAHALKLKRLELYLDLDRPLTESELEGVRSLVRRRGQREPLQYILGECVFYNASLTVDARALVPRSETEGLIELVLPRLKGTGRILELGTGSGAIALALARALLPNGSGSSSDCLITATDLSAESLQLAELNRDHLGLSRQVKLLQSDWFDRIEAGANFDAILSNPPYLSEAEYAVAEPEVKDYEPKSALVASDAGMADLKKIIRQAIGFLVSGGFLALETGIDQHAELIECAQASGYSKVESHSDLSQRDRYLILHH